MAEATIYNEASTITVTVPSGGFDSGEILQLCDGRAAYVSGLRGLSSGERAALQTAGQVTVTKIATKTVLAGGKLYWDRSASSATPIKTSDSFFIGVAVDDAAKTATSVVVDLNVEPRYLIKLGEGRWTNAATDGEGVSLVAEGSPELKLSFDAVSEVAMAALYSADTVPVADGPIFEGKVAVYDKGDDDALDINWGLANATHGTDADSITESVFFHVDGNATTLSAESDDDTAEVNATDTTLEAADDTYAEYWIDARDLTDIKLYVDGVQVCDGTTGDSKTFKLNNATGPIFPIVHMEKTSDDTTADVRVYELQVRSTDLT